MRRRFLFSLLVATLVATPARSVSLVADLSSHLIAITTGFSGAEVLLFGAVDGPGDVIVVVRGPEREQVLLRKSRVAGIWMNTARIRFRSAPTFYALSASRPLAEIAAPAILRSHELGIENLRLDLPSSLASSNIAGEWREALIAGKQRQGLFARAPGSVTFLGDRLFRTSVYLPPNVPVGLYRAEIYLLRDGQVVSAQATPLTVSKVGIEAEIFFFAHQNGALYGLIAVLAALVAGWLGHLAFRRG